MTNQKIYAGFVAALMCFSLLAATAESKDYDLLNPWQGISTKQRLNEIDSVARAAEAEAAKQYEQAGDYFNGDAEAYR